MVKVNSIIVLFGFQTHSLPQTYKKALEVVHFDRIGRIIANEGLKYHSVAASDSVVSEASDVPAFAVAVVKPAF